MPKYQSQYYSIEIDEQGKYINDFTHNSKKLIFEQMPIFAMMLRNEEGDELKTNSTLARKVEFCEGDGLLSFTYTDFINLDILVLVTLRVDKQSPIIKWRISVKNNTPMLIEWIDFPQIVVPNDLVGNGGDSRILWGFNEGVLIEDMNLREKSSLPYIEPKYPSVTVAGLYPAIVETQFIAYFNETSGLYLGSHDANGNLKLIEVVRYGSGIRLQLRIYPGISLGESYEMDYDTVMGTFVGEWQDAADIYRKWFEENCDKAFVKISDNKNLPEWYGESPIVVTYPVRGVHDTDDMKPNKLFPYINALPHIEQLEKTLNSKLLVLLMHWEGTAPWAPPYVWPPYGGEEILRDFCNILHDKGHILGVYCSGVGWTQRSGVTDYNMEERFEKEELWKEMCLSPHGDLPYSLTCQGIRYGYDLCPSTPFTVKTLSKEVEHMIDGGIDYIQVLDQNSGGQSLFCYSKEHGHPPSPGKWQTDCMISLLKKFNDISKKRNKKVLFGCEFAAAESFIPYMLLNDNRFNLNFSIGRPVPLYAYLYHEYVNNFMGNQVSTHGIFDHDLFPQNLYYRIAYSFHAGDMATLVINQDGKVTWNWGDTYSTSLPNHNEVVDFIKHTNIWRMGIGKKYLHLGKMVKPFTLNGDLENELVLRNGEKIPCSKLLTSCFKAEDGSVGQIVVNYTEECIECKISLIGINNYYIYNTPDSITSIQEKERNATVTLSLQPLSAKLIVIPMEELV